jgi:tRNA(adenine34) deaminase
VAGADDERLMQEALVLAERGLAEDEQPIGAVVALDGRVVGSGFWRYRPDGLLDHAEIVALRDAEQDGRLGGRRAETTLYTTLEPCLLCMAPPCRAGSAASSSRSRRRSTERAG